MEEGCDLLASHTSPLAARMRALKLPGPAENLSALLIHPGSNLELANDLYTS